MKQPAPISQTLRVHQLVHGYDGGHRLLAGSCELPSAAGRRILMQSDLSGSLPPKNYHTYLSGYPVREMESYAFARTWYAKEMQRPGCVWTHTLLIPQAALGKLTSLEPFAASFVRPSTNALDLYREPLNLETHSLTKSGPLLADAHALAHAFYREPARPVVFADPEPDRGEVLFLALWAQLWPFARMELAFSSGSLAARKIDSRPFDLQLAPPTLARDVARAAGAEQIDLFATHNPQPGRVDWRIVAEDLVFPANGEFREFLHRVADEQLTRGDVPNVARVFDHLSKRNVWDKSSLRELYNLVGELFPSPEQAATLKRHCLSIADTALGSSADQWIIVEMSSQGWGEAFASPQLGSADRTKRLLSDRSDVAVDLPNKLLEHTLNTFGERIAHETIATLTPPQVMELLSRRPQFISTFVKLRPTLTKDASFWRALHSNSHEILETLATVAKDNADSLTGVFPALFASGLECEASHFVSLFGTAAAEAIFTHRGPAPLVFRDRWMDALAARPDIILATLDKMPSLTPAIVSGVAATYDPSLAAASRFPLEAWKAAMGAWSPAFTPEVRATVEACAFTLTLAFRLSTPVAADLAVLSFATTHAAAENGNLPSAAWSNLESVVPSISLFKDWDRCERMRRALIFSFASGQWPIDRFFPTLKDSHILGEVIKTALYLSEGNSLLEQLVNGIKDGEVLPDPQQLALFTGTLEHNPWWRKWREGLT